MAFYLDFISGFNVNFSGSQTPLQYRHIGLSKYHPYGFKILKYRSFFINMYNILHSRDIHCYIN